MPKITDARNRSKVYREGGEVESKEVFIPKHIHNTKIKTYPDGARTYETTARSEVMTKDGPRWYEGIGESAQRALSRKKAEKKAIQKSYLNPSDSLIAGGEMPIFETEEPKKKKKKKKKGFFRRKKK